MLIKAVIVLAALATIVTASPYQPTLVARKPPNTTGAGVGRPTSLTLTMTAYYASSNCSGNSSIASIPSDKCVTLPFPAQSWSTSSNGVNTQQIEMVVYGNAICQAPGMVEHLDVGSTCMTIGGLSGGGGNGAARSVEVIL